MASIKNSEVIKLNEGLSNGFKFDIQFFCIWGEKEAVKIIELPENCHLEVRIGYLDSRRSWQVKNGELKMEMRFHLWRPTSTGCFASTGFGHSLTLGTGYSRKMFNKIQEMTKDFPEERLLNMWEEIQTSDDFDKWGNEFVY